MKADVWLQRPDGVFDWRKRFLRIMCRLLRLDVAVMDTTSCKVRFDGPSIGDLPQPNMVNDLSGCFIWTTRCP